MDRARVERQMRALALEHVRGGLADDSHLARLGALRKQVTALETRSEVGVSPGRAIEWLRVIGTTWRDADVPEAKAGLVHAIDERIVVAGPEFVSARLTPDAYAHGLALALP
jgi:hypothetical protein